MNAYDFSIKMEKEHKAYYEKLAATAGSSELKTIFSLLADSEREHLEHLMLMRSGGNPSELLKSTLESVKVQADKIFDGLSPSDFIANDSDGYRHAIKEEEESIALYEQLAREEPNRAAAEVLQKIATEEKAHLEMMTNIYDFVEAPKTYLAWGEFSNLKEY